VNGLCRFDRDLQVSLVNFQIQCHAVLMFLFPVLCVSCHFRPLNTQIRVYCRDISW